MGVDVLFRARGVGFPVRVSGFLACVALSACGSSLSPLTGGRSDSGMDATFSDAPSDTRRADARVADALIDAPTASRCPPWDGSNAIITPMASLTVSGDQGSTFGISDPSLVWPAGSADGYVSFTSLENTGLFTRVAKTSDGTSFTYVGDANASSDVMVQTTDSSVCGAATCPGRMVHETSALVDDPGDPDASRRFKLFDYTYVIVPTAMHPHQNTWGYIGLYTAQAPEMGWSSGTKAIGWSSTADSVSTTGAATVASTVSALQDCQAFTEPAGLVDPARGTLYLALGCQTAASARAVLLQSTDHAATFSYVGVLLSAADGTSLGSASPGLMPSDFFQSGGATSRRHSFTATMRGILSPFAGSSHLAGDSPVRARSSLSLHRDTWWMKLWAKDRSRT